MAKAAAASEGEVLAPESPSDPTPRALRKRPRAVEAQELMFERLVKDPSVDPDKLRQMIDLHERVQAAAAKAAFDDAFAAMMPDIPTIIETARTDKTTYAPLEDIVEQVKPILARHGFALHFTVESLEGGITKVTGMLSRGGHTRVSYFQSAPDKTGSKNEVQALGSVRSYGKRYTTGDLLCIVTRKEDDDGEKSGRGKAQADEVPVQPRGYPEWLIDLTATADNGSAALEAMWRDPKSEAHRKHLWATDKPKWERIKVRAGMVDVQMRGKK